MAHNPKRRNTEKRKAANDNRKPSNHDDRDTVVYSLEIDTRLDFQNFSNRLRKCTDLDRVLEMHFGDGYQWKCASQSPSGHAVLSLVVRFPKGTRNTACPIQSAYLQAFNEQLALGGLTVKEVEKIAEQAKEEAMNVLYVSVLTVLHGCEML